MLCAGLEAAYLQGTQSATAVLRWREVPDSLPWLSDPDFRKRMSPELLQSAHSRRAYAQQDNLGEHFREAFLRAYHDPALEAMNLEAHWRDRDDPEDWLQVSQEDLDQEMKVRQAEFDHFDQKRRRTREGLDGRVLEAMARSSTLAVLLLGAALLQVLTFVTPGVPTARVNRSVTVFRKATATDDTMGKVAEVIAEQLGVDKDKVTREATLSELGADSLDIVESVMALEEAFDIELPDED
eukprot:g24565.t1